MPTPKSLAGRVALVTGGAGGIGSATAEKYLSEGACVMLADIDDDEPCRRRADNLAQRYGRDVVRTVNMNVTDEAAVAGAYAEIAVEYGGIDILVSNAGIASSAPVEETTLELWNRNIDILTTGYFLVSREAFKTMRAQDIGGADRLRRLEERPRREPQRLGLLHRQGERDPPRALPRARRRRSRHPGQRGQPRRGAARLEDLGGRMARRALCELRHRQGAGSKRCTATARC